MRLGIRGKQIVGVATIVGMAVATLSTLYVSRVSSVVLRESLARGQLLSNAIFHRARELVTDGDDPYAGLRSDPGLRSILAASYYGASLTGASVLDTNGVVVASSDPLLIGQTLPPSENLEALAAASAVHQAWTIYWRYWREPGTLEVVQRIFQGDEAFGSIHVGVSAALMRDELLKTLAPTLGAALGALAGSVLVAVFLANLLLSPIHVLRGGLTRLGKGEFGVTLDLPPGDEFGELGSFFNTVSQQLSADRTALAGQKANLQTTVEHLEDAVALFAPSGELRFSNPAMESILPSSAIGRPLRDLLPNDHPYRTLVEETLAARESRGPVQVNLQATPAGNKDADPQSDLMTHVIGGADGEPVGVLLVVRDAAYLSRVHSVIAYSRKLVALGRLTAGIAHEVKNPLNAMMIHLELLRTKIRNLAQVSVPESVPAGASGRGLGLSLGEREPLPAPVDGALTHVGIIEGEIRRLDEVVQGFLRFTRPEDLRLQAVRLGGLLGEITPLIEAEAQKNKVKVTIDCPATVPAVNGDAAMLRQVFTNLAINACQAMPNGGTLRVTCSAALRRRVEIRVEDSGSGIAPEHLGKIFDLYFTTKDHGTGIGLSMVYRIIQLHDGEIEVQSTLGRGTTFKVLLPRANE
jgi:signal transduction histidine kinase/HAMP domain-containing protein